ncbi:MAG: mechanosensitive ion channel family protein [Granulosicoccaceae bacterium]
MADTPVANEETITPADVNAPTTVTENLPEFADWLPDAVLPYWNTVAQYPIIGALVIATIFYVLAFVMRELIVRSLEGFAHNTQTDLDNRVLSGLKKPIFNIVFLFGLSLAVRAAQLPMGSELLIKILVSLILLALIRAAFFITTELLEALARNHHRFAAIEERTVPLLDIIAKLMILLFGSYSLLLTWGINPVGWLASAGIVGLAVGFAAQDTLANLFAGFFILIDSPYKVHDYVNLDSGERGIVTQIGMRSTRLLTRDDVEITIPNSVMGNAKIINESGGPHEKMRLRLAVGVAYGSDIHETERVLQAIAVNHKEICDNPAPRIRMRGLGDSSLDFELLGWIEAPEHKGRITHELYKQIYDSLNSANIEIPFPKRDLYIKEMPA